MEDTRRLVSSPAPAPAPLLPDPFAAGSSEAGGLAIVAHGPIEEPLPVAGMTVGAIRQRLGVRLNLAAGAAARLDGEPAADDAVVGPGQVLVFQSYKAVKGGLGRLRRPPPAMVPTELEVRLVGDRIEAATPEGGRRSLPIDRFVRDAQPRRLGDVVWPDGVKLVREHRRGAIVVHQTPPRVHALRWISDDSPAEFGPDAEYREVRIALPYVLVVAVYRVDRGGLQLSKANEAFFLNRPLTGVDVELLYPALLNVSHWQPHRADKPLAWVCTQFLDRSFERDPDLAQRSRDALAELLRHFFHGAFNRSSEHNEGGSWFGATVAAAVDPRVADIDAWQRATAADPAFATEVPWLPAETTLRGVLDRIAGYMDLDGPAIRSVFDVGCRVLNAGEEPAPEAGS